MTLCIAALCLRGLTGDGNSHFGDQCAVLGYDRRFEIAYSGATETGYKMERLGHSWWGMFAGTVPDAREILSFLRRHILTNEAQITVDNAIEHFERAVEQYRVARIDRYVHGLCGFTRAEFFANEDRLPKKEAGKIRQALGRGWHIGEQLILVGWIGPNKLQSRGAFHIFRYVGGAWQRCEDFAAIGSGSIIATTIWSAREESAIRFLPATMYRVYEALRFGSQEPSVGSNSALCVLTKERERLSFRQIENDAKFRELWAELGLKKLSSFPASEGDFRLNEPPTSGLGD